MERYAQRIIQILEKNNIPGIYNKEDRLIYAVYENGYGEIYFIYEYENATITNCAIYSCPIPDSKKDLVLKYLCSVNKVKNQGDFFFDRTTDCVAYNICYCVGNRNVDEDIVRFEEFCLKAYQMFSRHQQPLYKIINHKRILGN
ncbi:MAG: hypothetical protein ACK5KT_16670 [Dysgonomonas sp.]